MRVRTDCDTFSGGRMNSRRLILRLFFGIVVAYTCVASAFYDATVGRWLDRDPIEERGGRTLDAYVSNDPIDFIDYLGMVPNTPVGTRYQANELFGHAAITLDGTSYGFGPVDVDGNPFWTPGTTEGWDASTVPSPRAEDTVYIKRGDHDTRIYGGRNVSCKCATKDDVKSCAERVKGKWSNSTYSILFGWTCRGYVQDIMDSCCLTTWPIE